jgi:hypothetical protein
MPAYFLFPFETMWTQAQWSSERRRYRPRLQCQDIGGEHIRAAFVAVGREARRAGLRQLHLTTISAGGSRPEQACRTIQG